MSKLKKIILAILAINLILVICSTTEVKAESDAISSINIDVVINTDGTASITETWKTAIYSGTELYKPYYDLSTSEISNLSVTDETGTEYTYLSNWDINADQSEKTNKCGIYTNGNETDICWGIGNYGEHTYTIKYTISNFVQQYDDYQLVYFTLLQDNMEPTPESATITVSSTFDFAEDKVSINGYGYSGEAKIQDGKALFITNGNLGQTGYMSIYLKFSENYFEAERVSTNGNDVTTQNENISSESSSWTRYIPYILIGILVILVIVFIVVGRRSNYNRYNNNL